MAYRYRPSDNPNEICDLRTGRFYDSAEEMQRERRAEELADYMRFKYGNPHYGSWDVRKDDEKADEYYRLHPATHIQCRDCNRHYRQTPEGRCNACAAEYAAALRKPPQGDVADLAMDLAAEGD